MPDGMIEVTEAQLQELNNARSLLDSLLNDPKEGLSFKRKIREKYPNARLPDVDIIDQVTVPFADQIKKLTETLEENNKRFVEYRESVENKQAEETLKGALERIRSEYSFDDDGMTKVVEMMKDRNLAHDPDAAAALVARSMPRATPVSSSAANLIAPKPDVFGLSKEDAEGRWKTLQNDPWSFFDQAVVETLSEFESAA